MKHLAYTIMLLVTCLVGPALAFEVSVPNAYAMDMQPIICLLSGAAIAGIIMAFYVIREALD